MGLFCVGQHESNTSSLLYGGAPWGARGILRDRVQCYSRGIQVKGITTLSLSKYSGILLALVSVTACGDSLTVTDAYIRGLPPGQTVTAAFMTLHNGLAKDCRLVGAASPIASSAEIHAHTHHNGTMSMRPVDGVALPTGKSVSFKPGGYHLMLFGLKDSWSEEAQHKLTLFFEGCPEVTVVLPVRSVLHEEES